MNRTEALQALNKIPKVELPPTEIPTRSGMVGQAGAVLRIRDRQNAEANKPVEAKPETLYENEVRHFGVYWANIYRAQREADSKEKRIAAEKRRVAEAHRIDDIRRREDEEARNKKIVQQLFENDARAQVKHILSDCTGEEMTEILKRVEAAKMKGFPSAYQAFKNDVRTEKKS